MIPIEYQAFPYQDPELNLWTFKALRKAPEAAATVFLADDLAIQANVRKSFWLPKSGLVAAVLIPPLFYVSTLEHLEWVMWLGVTAVIVCLLGVAGFPSRINSKMSIDDRLKKKRAFLRHAEVLAKASNNFGQFDFAYRVWRLGDWAQRERMIEAVQKLGLATATDRCLAGWAGKALEKAKLARSSPQSTS